MSATSPDTGSLQFDKAEFAEPQASLSCAACQQRLEEVYFEVNGLVLCPGCKTEVERKWAGGSRTRRFLLASFLGVAAALLGAALWYGIRVITNYELGIISIAIGLGVGFAVRKGSGGRGGWAYQALAIFLTYSAVAMTYVPDVVKAFTQDSAMTAPALAPDGEAGALAPVVAEASADDGISPAVAEAETPVAAETARVESVEAGAAEQPQKLTGVQLAAGVAVFSAVVLGIAYSAPFLAGFDNLIGLLIIAFGLYEAWKINKRAELVVTGPLRVAQSVPAEETDSHG